MNIPLRTQFADGIEQDGLDKRRDFYAGVAGKILVRHYPSVNWLVDIKMSKTGGVLFIRVPAVSMKFGMVVNLCERIPEFEEDVMKAGGELLERFNIRRSEGADVDMMLLPKDIAGETLGADKGELTLPQNNKKKGPDNA